MTVASKPKAGDAADMPPPRKPARAPHASASPLPNEIVQRSILLFNRDGPQNVSTNIIAADLGISSGNLHYHFRTKQDLSRALYDLMEAELRHALRDIESPTVPDIVGREIELQRCLWAHRYFFAGFDLMVRKDPAMRDQFERLHGWAVARVTGLLDHYIRMLVLHAVTPPNTSALVAENTWMLWVSWVRWEVVMSSKHAPAADNEIIHRLVGHHLSFLAIMMSQDTAAELGRQLDQALLG